MDGYEIFRTAFVVTCFMLAIKYPKFRIIGLIVCASVGVWAALDQFYFTA